MDVSVAKARFRHVPNELSGGPESIQPFRCSSSPFSTGIEKSFYEVRCVGDEGGDEVSSIKESGGVHGCGHHTGSRNPSVPGRFTGRYLMVGSHPS